jgi:rhodanese-related sulfurtransferase
MKQITPSEAASWLNDAARPKPLLLDVREAWEFETCRVEGSTHIPMGEIPQRFGELDPGAEIIVICHHGGRSMQVAMFLQKQGFSGVSNLTGGVDAWAKTVDPTMPVY